MEEAAKIRTIYLKPREGDSPNQSSSSGSNGSRNTGLKARNMCLWSELPQELLQVIADKQTNYVDYLRSRAVCRAWRSAIRKRPHSQSLLRQLPFLLLPYHQSSPNHRGFYSIPDDKTYHLELPEAYDKRCCGSSHGWLVIVEDSPTVFLLNPWTRARIELPSLSTFPSFPTELLFRNSNDLDESFIAREKLHVRDTFIVKAIVSADPSLTTNFSVVVIYGLGENLAFCRSGDAAWTVIDEAVAPARYKDFMFQAGKLFVVDQMARVSVCSLQADALTLIRVADPPSVSPRIYKQWYLASLDQELLLVARYRKSVPDYEYNTERFEVYKKDSTSGSSWLKMESLGDKVLFLGCNSTISISASDYSNSKGNCIYFTDDYMRNCGDYAWEGHDFGAFDLDNGSVRSLDNLICYPTKELRFGSIFLHERSLCRNRSLFMLPTPIWVTISP